MISGSAERRSVLETADRLPHPLLVSPAVTHIRPKIDQHRTRDCTVLRRLRRVVTYGPCQLRMDKADRGPCRAAAPAAPHRPSVQQWWRAGRNRFVGQVNCSNRCSSAASLRNFGAEKGSRAGIPCARRRCRKYSALWVNMVMPPVGAMPALRQSVAFGIKSDSLPRLLREPRMVPSGRPFQRSCVPGRPTIFPNRGLHVCRTRAAPGGRPGQ
jgi:hypothetical protein